MAKEPTDIPGDVKRLPDVQDIKRENAASNAITYWKDIDPSELGDLSPPPTPEKSSEDASNRTRERTHSEDHSPAELGTLNPSSTPHKQQEQGEIER